MYCATTENQKNLDSFGDPGQLMGSSTDTYFSKTSNNSLFRRPVNKGISTTKDDRVGTQDHTLQQASSHVFKNIV